MISSNDFPFRTDGAALARGTEAVAGVGAAAVEVDPNPPVPRVDGTIVGASPGFAVVVAPSKPVPGVVREGAGLLAPKLSNEGGAGVSPVVDGVFLSTG
jgi:hypothetical protein